ncbi:MAG: hypothetical protein M3036_00900, partial [Bifidobacteriales bacterium]|nr:hypothetical protein [Bifidobacteriales bacterium]
QGMVCQPAGHLRQAPVQGPPLVTGCPMLGYPHSSIRALAPCLQAVGWALPCRPTFSIQFGRHGA